MKKLILITLADSWHHFEKPIKEYEKRLEKELEIILLKPSKLDNVTVCRERDTQAMIMALKKYTDAYIVLCDIAGKSFGSTEQFAEWINTRIQKHKSIIFIVGGSYGLDAELLQSSINDSLLLTSWTLPHALASLIMLEQLYRVTNLLAWGKYHH
jgi:23S rRNA (pseudouridine1915-N3)-methyltransferase